MENGPRAFVMASGVFIAMAVIGIAVSVFSNAAGIAGEVDSVMSSTQIASFNNFYTSYRTADNKIRCIDAVNILNRAIEDEVEVKNTSDIIKFKDGYYYSDSINYLNEVSYKINYMPGVGVVYSVEISN